MNESIKSTFHSPEDEDRIVKNAFRNLEKRRCRKCKFTYQKPVTTQKDELKRNPKSVSVSARLRAIEII